MARPKDEEKPEEVSPEELAKRQQFAREHPPMPDPDPGNLRDPNNPRVE